MLMPSLLACAFLNNSTVRTRDLYRLAYRVYPYVAEEYFLRWSNEELPSVVDETLEDLANHGLLVAEEGREAWHRPDAESPEAVQLSILARASVPILERYYITVALLLREGSGRLNREALVHQCQLTAQRMALLYELQSPEFFDRALFDRFVARLIENDVLQLTPEGRLAYEPASMDAIVADAKMVLAEQIRNSILQVVHR